MDREDDLARILLVRACEESDPQSRFVTRREREAATREARLAAADAAGVNGERLVRERAQRLSDTLERQHPALRAAASLVRLRLPSGPVLVITTAVGLAVDALGGQRRINLLAFPLLGLLAWNAAVYVAFALAPLLSRVDAGDRVAGGLARLVGALARRLPARLAPEEARWLGASLHRFTSLFAAPTGPLLGARVERALHVGALGFALGIVAGMYLRGLAFEYRASWESTFLDAPQVSALLSAVLGPAARVLDALRPSAHAVALLGEPALAGLHAPAGDGPAAVWVHLWALTAAGWIGLPRALLAARAARRARRLAARLAPDLGAPYFLRLLAPERGAGTRVEVIPYSHQLGGSSADALRELLADLFGERAQVSSREPLAYGAEPPEPLGDPQCRVVVFNLAQPPEQEVHGAFLESLHRECAARPHPPALLVLLDEEPYRERMGGGGRDRVGQRRRAWERVARPADLRVATLRPLEQGGDEVLAEARAALEAHGAAA
jgi:hypothetical protein